MTRRTRSCRGLGCIVAGLLLVLVAAGLFAAVPGALANQREYASAPACPDGDRSGSCTTSVPATVTRTDDEPHGRSVWHWIHFTEQGSDTVRRVRMAGTRPVFDTVRGGSEVTLTYWKGEIRTVRSGATTQETHASPAEDWRWPTAFGLLTLPFGLGVLLCGLWLRSHPASTTPPARSWGLIGILAGAFLSCVGAPAAMLSSGLPEALLFTAAGLPPVLLLVTLYARRAHRRTTEPALTAPGT
ncbi:hypothetical protein [Streptomyces sp. NPDC052610]|uniref:hypothetical protein n=1 Tax=Streptomyces sp. NPDC052610 TaxID=3154952 RepID=UPI0034241B85